MLQKIREKVSGWVAGVVLALLGFVFAVWGIDIGFNSRNYAAVVNGEEIPIAPVRQAIQNQLSQFSQSSGVDLPPGLEEQVRISVIESFVRNRLLVERVRDQGYRVGDEQLGEEVRSMPEFAVGGQFSLDAYRAMLANVGYSTTSFEAEQRQNLEIGQLQDGILRSSFITGPEVDRRVMLDNEQREVAWLTLPLDAYLEQTTVDPAAVDAAYAEHPDRYLTPETVDVQYLEVRLADLAAATQIEEQQLREYYEVELSRNPDLFSTPEQRRTRHMLFSVDDDAGEAAALEKANAALARVRAGEDFAELAKELSEDSGSAGDGGDLDWVERGMMVAPFEEALFAMESGAISEPVRSPFGYHVIFLEEVRPGSTKSFEDARVELEEQLRTIQAEDRYYAQAEVIERMAFENPDSLQPAADAAGLPLLTLQTVTRSGGSGLATQPQFRNTAFSAEVLNDGANSALIELTEGQAVVLRVAEHYPATPRPLEEVRDRIESLLRREQARDALDAEAVDVEARLNEGGDAAALAEVSAATFQAPRTFGRDAEDVPDAILSAAFSAQQPAESPTITRADLLDGSRAIVMVSQVIQGEPQDLDESERTALRDRLAGESGNQELVGYVEQLRNDATVLISTEQFQ